MGNGTTTELATRRRVKKPSPDFERLAAGLGNAIEPLLFALFERLNERHPDGELHANFSEDQLFTFARSSLEAQLRFFGLGVLPEECPRVDAVGGGTAFADMSLPALLAFYSAMQATVADAWIDLVEAADVAYSERRGLVHDGLDFFSRYAALLSEHVTGTYQLEVERGRGNGEGRRLQAVRSLLAGEAGVQLDFNLHQYHLGVIAWGEGAPDAIRHLARLLERPPLVIGPVGETWWAWVSGARAFEADDQRLLGKFTPCATARLAVGRPAYGEDGFRLTHRQAQGARWATRFAQQPLVHFSDVAVEHLASENRVEAVQFLAHELRGINDDSDESTRARETLRAYFESGHNAASAAARLGVHQQTIANRLRAIEDRLGCPVESRRVELEVALRLRRCLGEPSTT